MRGCWFRKGVPDRGKLNIFDPADHIYKQEQLHTSTGKVSRLDPTVDYRCVHADDRIKCNAASDTSLASVKKKSGL